MNLELARRMRDFFRKHGMKATVPLGYTGDDYFVKVKISGVMMVFKTPGEYNAYVKKCNKDWLDRMGIDTRSPIIRMIDEACGYEPNKPS